MSQSWSYLPFPIVLAIVAVSPPEHRGAGVGALGEFAGSVAGVDSVDHDVQAEPTLTIGRLQYEGGGDWYANPSSLPNLLSEINARTALNVSDRERVITLTSPDLWEVPYLYMTGHGNVLLEPEAVVALRTYLENGGFLHADDNYGMDESFRREILRVFPDNPLVEVPLDHPIYDLVYTFNDGIPKIHEHDEQPAQGFGIFLDDRLVVYYSYQSDLGDGWEDPDVHDDPDAIREQAIRMGVNLFVYAVTTSR